MGKPLLELTKLSRHFITDECKVTALKNINLTIYAGEMVAIVGASGSGKSTLMNILGCLDNPNEGTYKVAGQEVSTLDKDMLAQLRREHFGFIFQQYHLLSHLNALENTEVPAVYAGVDKASRSSRAEELLRRLGLGDRYRHLPSQLSGGQQQRISIARALMNGGEVILADEPTGALDSKSGSEIMGIFHELHDQGHTIIIVTHNKVIAQHAERIIEISDGEIISDRPNIVVAKKSEEFSRRHQIAKPSSVLQASWGRFIEAFKMAMIAIASHKIRTLLTMLGIIIGITAVVTVIAIGQGARQKIIENINAMGTNVIRIYPGGSWGEDNDHGYCPLSPADLEILKLQIYADSVTPEVHGGYLLRYRNVKANVSLVGVGDQYFRVNGMDFDQGIPLRATDTQKLGQVVIIDKGLSKKLFSNRENPLGKIIFIGSIPAQIIGIVKEPKNRFMSMRNTIWMPYTTVMGKLLGQSYFNSITLRVKDGMSNQIAEQNIIKLLKQRHGNVIDFSTFSSDTIIKSIQKTSATMRLMILAIAVISLLVGGIGVMNIMLVAVSERTKEIGIRMAVGARQSDIMQQFLIEAVIVCLVGGIIGVVLSLGIGLIFHRFVTTVTMIFSFLSFIIAFFCSTMIGVAFGFLPALNAAKLNPIVALARE